MKFTLDWLKDHLETKLSSNIISEKLTSLGMEVESVTDNNKKFENFVVGYIEKADRHPNADKLQICEVDIGDKVLTIVCGAKNARPGIYVVVALVGAIIPDSNTPLKKGNIRGFESQGMLCSTDELLIESDGIDGIIELSNEYIPGTPAAKALGFDSIVFDVSITPNRADCFSVRGIARDLAAIGCGTLLPLKIHAIEESFENPIDVEIKTDSCAYFSTCALQGVSGKTPSYIARRLGAIGQKAIHCPVDVANYICIDIGQPLHIFDSEKLTNKLVVRDFIPGEKLKTLDGKETIIPENAIIVATEDTPLSIAGIMGGEDSAFSENSKNILIEAAYFDKIAISKTGQALRMVSDSRTRFERGIDPENIDMALKYAVSIISSNCKCQISNTKKYGIIPNNTKIIELTFNKFTALTNLKLEDFRNCAKILENLNIKILDVSDDVIRVESPSYRYDLEIEEDIIEEILRIIGYDNIKEEELKKEDPKIQIAVVDKFSDALVYNGYYEVKTFSFIDEKTASIFAPPAEILNIMDPLTVEFSKLRPTVIASHLKSIKNSQNKSQKNSKIFEVGKRFYKINESIFEENTLVATISENKTNRNWRHKQEKVSVFDIKEDLERLLSIACSGFRISNEAPNYYHPGRSGSYIIQKDTVVAHFGEIHPSVLSSIGVSGPIVCFELFLDKLPKASENKAKQPIILSQYQPTTRDFSFIVNKDICANKILETIKKLRIDSIKNISIFDVYESSSLGDGKKAIAFEILMQSDKETLSEEQIKEVSEKIITAISKECNGILRDQ